ncbi:hypothetical protein M5K25_013214 [Dendrobium thyrsiflorum]|uniref:Uncharacterized protein n=1 Tax=Dendrobium thyrsiflorum TaxID=117978 RepID=A0ABD0UZU3_DENTH
MPLPAARSDQVPQARPSPLRPSPQEPAGPPRMQALGGEDWVLCRVFYKRRPLSSKIRTESCDEDTDTSSLPALTDSHITSYDHVPLNLEGLEQVPCFSNFSTSQETPSLFSSSFNTNVSCDLKELKAMLSQLSKIEENQQINESCFSDSAIPTLWNPFASF